MDIITRQVEDRFATDSFRQICSAEDLLIWAVTGKLTQTNCDSFWIFVPRPLVFRYLDLKFASVVTLVQRYVSTKF